MKVTLFDRGLWKEFLTCLSFILTILSIALTIVDCTIFHKAICIGIFFIISTITFLFLYHRANNMLSRSMRINGTRINIVYGDIFMHAGWKVIPFNEFYDTKVDGIVISPKSLNGIFINEYVDDIKELEECIKNNGVSIGKTTNNNDSDKNAVKRKKYPLGSIRPYNDFMILSFSHFDKDNKANLSIEDYLSCLFRMWKEIDKLYAGKSIVVPLLGSGITRLSPMVTEQELLEYIILSFKASKIKFAYHASLTIILHEQLKRDIDLYHLKGE